MHVIISLVHDSAELGGTNGQRPPALITTKIVVADGMRSMRSAFIMPTDVRRSLTAISYFCRQLTASPFPYYLPNKAATPLWKPHGVVTQVHRYTRHTAHMARLIVAVSAVYS